jgi:hypothetical protein
MDTEVVTDGKADKKESKATESSSSSKKKIVELTLRKSCLTDKANKKALARPTFESINIGDEVPCYIDEV